MGHSHCVQEKYFAREFHAFDEGCLSIRNYLERLPWCLEFFKKRTFFYGIQEIIFSQGSGKLDLPPVPMRHRITSQAKEEEKTDLQRHPASLSG
jgi:hypothetical protein